MTKICSICKIEKDVSKFHKQSSTKSGYRSACKVCRNIEAINNRENKKLYDKVYNQKNKDKKKEQSLNYYKNNKDKVNAYRREYMKTYKQDKEKINSYRINKRNTDINYRLKDNLRRRINHALKDNVKSQSTFKLIGCSIEELKSHLQQTALSNGYLDFNINDYNSSEYHIDHIIPCASFDLSNNDEQLKCFHYSNLQILTAQENRLKSDNY